MQHITFIFPNIHYDYEWDVSDGRSLWSIFVLNNITESPLRLNNQSEIMPGLVSEWSFSKDRTQLLLKLNLGYTFHNGTPVETIDLLKSLQRTIQNNITAHSDLADQLCHDGKCDSFKQISNDTIEISFKNPINGFMANLTSPEFGVVPPDYYNDKITSKKEGLKNLSGPYKLKKFDKKEMVFEAHSQHPLMSSLSPKNARIIEIGDIKEAIEYYLNEKSAVLIGSDYSSALHLKNLPGKSFISSFALTEFFIPNVNSPILDTPTKRQTLFSYLENAKHKLVIDEELATKTGQIFAPGSPVRLSEEDLKDIYDDTIATKGPSKGTPIHLRLLIFDWMKESPIPKIFQELLKENNIILELIVVDIPTGREILKSGDFDLAYIYSGVTSVDPINELIYLFKHPISNFADKNERNTLLLKETRHIVDKSDYYNSLKDIHRSLIKDFRVFPIIHTRMNYLSRGNYALKEMSIFNGGFNVWDWRISPNAAI